MLHKTSETNFLKTLAACSTTASSFVLRVRARCTVLTCTTVLQALKPHEDDDLDKWASDDEDGGASETAGTINLGIQVRAIYVTH